MSRRITRNHHLMIWPALLVVLLDQASKAVLVERLTVHESVSVVDGFFNLVHVKNRGMAFGFLNDPHGDLRYWFLVGVSFVAIFLVLLWFFRTRIRDARVSLGLSLILGGAIGNLIDRLRFREVIDFLDFYLGPYHWPAFNVADAAITAGTLLVAVTLVFRGSSSR